MRNFIYIACPYMHEDMSVMLSRVKASERYFASLVSDGIFAINPISCHYAARDNDLELGWEFWEAMDKKLIDISKEIHVLQLSGWQESRGVQSEIAYANESGIPICYVSGIEI